MPILQYKDQAKGPRKRRCQIAAIKIEGDYLMTKNKFITFEEVYEKKQRSKKIFIGTYITITLVLISLMTYFMGQA